MIGLIFISSAVANPLVACTERQTHMEGNVVVLDRCEPALLANMQNGSGCSTSAACRDT